MNFHELIDEAEKSYQTNKDFSAFRDDDFYWFIREGGDLEFANLKYAFDYDFILRVKKKYKIFLIPKILGKFTKRENSLTYCKRLSNQRSSDLLNILKYSKNNFHLSLKIKLIIYLKIFRENLSIQFRKFKNMGA